MEVGPELVLQARQFAIQAHGHQMYGALPYSTHLAHVESVLIEYGFDSPELRAAAWLHDVIEDTDTTLGNLDVRFPERVCALVYAVTAEPGANRDERNAKTYPKIAALREAVIVKLADRIANVRVCVSGNRYDLLRRYTREYTGFRRSLKYADGPPQMWAELDSILLPKRSAAEDFGEKPFYPSLA